MERCWDACGVEKVEADCKWGRRKTSPQMNPGPSGLGKGGRRRRRSVPAGCESFKCLCGESPALEGLWLSAAVPGKAKARRSTSPAPAQTTEGLGGVPLLSALVLCSAFCSMARLYPCSEALGMHLGDGSSSPALGRTRAQLAGVVSHRRRAAAQTPFCRGHPAASARCRMQDAFAPPGKKEGTVPCPHTPL